MSCKLDDFARDVVQSKAGQFFMVDTRWVEDGAQWETLAVFCKKNGEVRNWIFPARSATAHTKEEADENHYRILDSLQSERNTLKVGTRL